MHIEYTGFISCYFLAYFVFLFYAKNILKIVQ